MAEKSKRQDRAFKDETLDTNSSGTHADPIHTREDRHAADPALEPELAAEREELAREDREKAAEVENKTTDKVAQKSGVTPGQAAKDKP